MELKAEVKCSIYYENYLPIYINKLMVDVIGIDNKNGNEWTFIFQNDEIFEDVIKELTSLESEEIDEIWHAKSMLQISTDKKMYTVYFRSKNKLDELNKEKKY